MENPGSAPDASRDAVLGVFERAERPRTPLTTAEVADRLDCGEATATDRLQALADRGDLHYRELDAPARLWWPAGTDGPDATDGHSVQFRRFIDAVEDYAIFTLDPDGHVASWNDGAERIKGYGEGDILGRHLSTFYTEEAVANGVPEENLAAARDRGRVEDEGWRVRVDGEEFWAHVVITAIRDDEGTLQGFTKVTRDLTEQREYEQQLRRERDLSRQILETVPVSITVVDADGEFIRANSRALDRLGLTEEELAGYTADAWDVYDTDGEPIPPGETPWARAIETGAPVADVRCQVDLPDVGRRWLAVDAAPIDPADDTGPRVVLSVDDVTDQVARERALRRERNQTEELLRTAPIAIAVQTATGETVMANDRAQEVLGLSERELREEPDDPEGWTLYDADGDPIGRDETPTARARATEAPVFDAEMAIEDPSGERTWLSINATPVFDQDGDLDRVITAGEDITQLKRREHQLERRASELETELSEVLGRVSDAFYALDEELRFTHVNDRAEELLQRPRAELLGERIDAVFPEVTETAIWDRFHEAIATQEAESFEFRYDELDAWLEITAYPSETGLSVYFQDITERKDREEALERYRTIVETVNDGIYTVDPDSRFTMVNETYAEMTGYARDELLGAHVSLVVEDAVTESASELEERLVSGEEETVTIEAEILRADGGTVPAEASFSLLPARDGYERVGVVRDISERLAQKRALEESERRYRTLADNFPNGVVALFDEDMRYTAAGGQLLDELGVDPEDAIGASIWDRYPEAIAAEIEPYFHDAFAGEQSSFEVDYLGRHLLAHTLPILDADDEIAAGMLVVQDITERVEFRRQLKEIIGKLEESNERLEQFAYIASHDLQEPLRMVSSYLQLIQDRYADRLDEDGEEFLEFAVEGAERMRTMVQGLLTYSRLDTDAEPLEPTDPATVVDRVLDQLQLQVEENDAEVIVGDLPTVDADEDQLEQVFQNLVSNAIKYRDDDPPRIEIGADRLDGTCRFRVADNGIGIDPEYTDQIFEVFKRLHSSKEYPGTGIGLALCEKIVDRHGGKIWVESAPGDGSTFYFTLPLADRADG